MSSNAKSWIGAWIILTAFTNIAGSLPLSQGKIPYDVVLPPDGNGESLPPVIMMHGLLDWRKTWKSVAPAIAKNTGRKVYAYDALNHGDSEWDDNFDSDILVTELDHFMEEHNISSAVLVGHSMGGKIAMIFSLQKPEKVEKLIIEDIPSRKANSRDVSMMKLALLSCKLALEEFSTESDELAARKIMLSFIERFILKDQIIAMGEDFLIEWMPITKRDDKLDMLANLDLFIKIANTPTAGDVYPDLVGEYNGDVLFLYGTKSIFNVSDDKMIPKHFPRVTFVRFEGGSHMIHFQFFKEFAQIVSDFINNKSTTLESQ